MKRIPYSFPRSAYSTCRTVGLYLEATIPEGGAGRGYRCYTWHGFESPQPPKPASLRDAGSAAPISLHKYIYMCLSISISISTSISTSMYRYRYRYRCIYIIHTYMHIHTYVYICVYICICIYGGGVRTGVHGLTQCSMG